MSDKVILCVDDEKFVLDSLQRELELSFKSEFVVESAENGFDALEIVSEIIGTNRELPVIIADYIMPAMKGDELLIKIHDITPETRKIMLTGQATMEGVTNAVNRASLYRYIAKPWERRDLALTVAEAAKSFERDKQLKLQHEEIFRKNAEITAVNENLENIVAERTADLKAKQKEITDSINYAKRIQSAVMGPTKNIRKMLPESDILYIPKDIVSGDFYWFSEKNGIKIIAAGDCTGHGVPGAFMSLIGISLLNRIVNERGIVDPDVILNELRRNVITLLQQTGKSEETKDGMDIALAAIDTENGFLRFAGAYNSLYLISSKTGELIEYKGDRMPVGICERKPRSFGSVDISLRENDLIYLFTDGLIDQFGGPLGKKMLSSRLKSLLLEVKRFRVEEQIEAVRNFFYTWKGAEEQIDDVLLVCCRHISERSI